MSPELSFAHVHAAGDAADVEVAGAVDVDDHVALHVVHVDVARAVLQAQPAADADDLDLAGAVRDVEVAGDALQRLVARAVGIVAACTSVTSRSPLESSILSVAVFGTATVTSMYA